jgi:hypothetical protein
MNYIRLSINSALYCESKFGIDMKQLNDSPNNMNCKDIIYFSRIYNILKSSR